MWTPTGPKNIHGTPLTGKRNPPRFKVGDRVWILDMFKGDDGKAAFRKTATSKSGTIEAAPKTSKGSYIVRFDGGYILRGRDVPQSTPEYCLAPMTDAEIAERLPAGQAASPEAAATQAMSKRAGGK